METPKEDDPVFLDRGSRSTRGKRMTRLLDNEIEEDELFWNQEALNEVDLDDNYEEEADVADEFDSDFNEDEPEPDEGVEQEPDDRTRIKKRLILPGKSFKSKKEKKKEPLKFDNASDDEKSSEQRSLGLHKDASDDPESGKAVRKSMRTSVIVRQAERDAIRAALQATMKPVKRKKEGEEKRMTQEEMLLEAAQTEIINMRNLERVLAREEEVKKRATVHKRLYDGPRIRYSSKNGCSYIEFSEGLSFQTEINTMAQPYPDKSLCAVTGLPAKYRDPKTGMPYATKEAFKIIRERFSDENSRARKERDTGSLLHSISGQGFSARRRRSAISNRNRVLGCHFWARFGRIPALENQFSD